MATGPESSRADAPRRRRLGLRGLSALLFTLWTLFFLVLMAAAAIAYRYALDQREVVSDAFARQLRDAEQLRYLSLERDQAWRSVILRGEDPESYHRYLARFYALEREIRATAGALRARLDPGTAAAQQLDTFEEASRELGRVYRRALRTYNDSIAEPHLAADAVTRTAAAAPGAHITGVLRAIEDQRGRRYGEITARLRAFEWGLAAALLLLSALALGLWYLLLQRVVLRPMDKGVRLAEDIARGDLDRRLEVGRAAAEVHRLLAALERMRVNLRLVRKEMTAAREQAERSNLAKSDFLSRMSHELRTPLNAILGFGELLHLDDDLSGEQREQVDEILRAGNHLLTLINEVLDLARIENNRLEVTIEDVEVADLAAECVSLLAPLAARRGTRLVNRIAREAGFIVRGDYLRLKQSLINLLSNAVKYGHEGGEVVIGCQPVDGGRLRLLVSDDGPGIPPDRQHLLFKPFERIDPASHVEGTGIGLALTRRLVELMAGSVGVDSAEGRGSSFWLELPLAATRAVPAPLREAAPVVGPVQDGTGEEPRYSLLYVEDNLANTRLVEKLLRKRPDIRLLTAHSGSLGLDLAVAYRPDLILLDIHLPEMDGLDVLRALRADPATRAIPAIAVSANASAHDLEAGRAAGFVDYLVKPLNVNLFYQRLEQLLPASPRAPRVPSS
ncbi:MAG: ATP-binding protein [Pseudohaliea sp.]